MIRLYRDLRFFNRDDVLFDNEAFFENTIEVSEFYGDFLKVMSIIDHAELLDIKTGMIKTPFGICSKDYLSTGCKTVLNLIYMYRHKDKYDWVKAINATECGINAINEVIIFLEKTGYDIGIVIEHGEDMFLCKESDYLIDDKLHVNKIGLEWFIREEV